MSDKQFIAVVGGGPVGSDPLDRKTWSGSSYAFFSEIQRRKRLFRAFGVEVSRQKKWFYIARNLHRDRKSWRKRFHMDVAYRRELTREVGRRLLPGDADCDFVQIGAMFNAPEVLPARTRCFSYHDSSVAESMRSLDAPKYVSKERYNKTFAFEKGVYHAMTKVFTMSRHLRAALMRDFEVPPDRVAVLGAGINLDPFPEYEPDKRYDSRETLFIGVDFARKGGWELLRAFNKVRGRIPDARLHIVGPEHLKIPQDLSAGVECHGFLSKTNPDDGAKLQSLFRRCSLFVLPSLYEPFGLAPLEAMAHQIPCLASNTGALPEFVIPHKTGDLVEPGSADDLAEKLTMLIREPDLLRRMGDTGRQMVIEEYTWKRVVDRFLKLVSET